MESAQTVSDDEEFEDVSDVIEDDGFDGEVPTSQGPYQSPLIPEDVEDETAGSIHFIDGFTSRYGDISPTFFIGTLENAFKEACFRPARDRRLLAIYLHHDRSVLTNIFCTHLLGVDTIQQTLADNFVVWGWDLTNTKSKNMYLSSISKLLGNKVGEAAFAVKTEQLPALLIVSRFRSNTELIKIIHGSVGVDDLLSMLIEVVDLFNFKKQTEVKEEDERLALERIKSEQDEAYEKSLEMDRAKDEIKRQQQLIEMQREEDEKEKEAEKEAERLKAASQLPEEPNSVTPHDQIVTFRFRSENGNFFQRKFYSVNDLNVVFNYLLSMGYRLDEYKFIRSWPKTDLSELDIKSSLKQLQFCPQETIILQKR